MTCKITKGQLLDILGIESDNSMDPQSSPIDLLEFTHHNSQKREIATYMSELLDMYNDYNGDESDIDCDSDCDSDEEFSESDDDEFM